ncbi:hypothetical protein ACFVJS_24555 [Nocardioides sp. NPDC057772]|uniref:hypothetical protein n=1 Tax=Nocardioides sp. NPDC057772 TaxID=3346245 RepID=UPI00366DB1E4
MTTSDSPKPSGPSNDGPPGMPSWVKYLLAALLAVVLLAVLAMLITGGEHGPGRHIGGMGPASVVGAIAHGTSW